MRSESAWSFVILMLFLGMLFLVFYDYFTAPVGKILPFIFILFFSVYNFYLKGGEFMGNFIQGLAKKNFITAGGLIGVYEGHEVLHSGMITYYFSTYTRYLKYCNYFEYVEVGIFKRFLLALTPSTIAKVTDYGQMFNEIPQSYSDTPEGTIFYAGTLRGVKLPGMAEVLKMRLKKALATITEASTHLESAIASSEASAQGDNKKMVTVSVQAAQILKNFDKTGGNDTVVLERRDKE